MKIQYAVIEVMHGKIEETLNNRAKDDWILVQIIALPDDTTVTIVMEKIDV